MPLDVCVAQLRRLRDDQRRRRSLPEDAQVEEEEVGGEAGGRGAHRRQHLVHSRAEVSVHAQEKGDEVSSLLQAAQRTTGKHKEKVREIMQRLDK